MPSFKRWQLAIIVALSVGFIAALYTVAEFGRARLSEAAADVQRAHEQWIRVVDLQQLLMDAESGHRGFLLTGDPRHLAQLADATDRVDALAGQLAAVHRGKNPRVRSAIRSLRSVAVDKVEEMNESVALYRSQGRAAALARSDSRAELEAMVRFRDLADVAREYEESLVESSLANWGFQLQVVRRLNLTTLLVGLALIAFALVTMAKSIRQRQDAAAELARQHDLLKAQADAQSAELTELYRHLQHVQEEERAQLSRGLHDELGGVLLAARMDVTWLQHKRPPDPEEYRVRLERIRTALDQGIDLKRRVVEELRPTLLDTMGLVAALRWQIEETCRRADLTCREQLPDDEPVFSRAGAITLFRVVQEALANVIKHAHAKEVHIALEFTDQDVLLTIGDDGVGSTPAALTRPKVHGIAGMRHRIQVLGGSLDIATAPSAGMRIRVRVPLASVLQSNRGDTGASGTFATVPRVEPGSAATASGRLV
jgi:signal transduction histidine kinase